MQIGSHQAGPIQQRSPDIGAGQIDVGEIRSTQDRAAGIQIAERGRAGEITPRAHDPRPGDVAGRAREAVHHDRRQRSGMTRGGGARDRRRRLPVCVLR
jgi:hypothetical protein